MTKTWEFSISPLHFNFSVFTENMEEQIPLYKHYLKAIIPGSIALLYGLIAWLVFASDLTDRYANIVSWSFIAVLPFTLGGLVTILGTHFCGHSPFWTYFAPSITITLGVILSFITRLEALLCVVVAFPIMILPCFLGGLFASFLMKKYSKRVHLNMLILLPYLSPIIENQWEKPQEVVTIKDQIIIQSDVETIWKKIASVEEIQREELPFQWIYLLDFPRPLSAEIDHYGVGGKRVATFERDVSFFEVVTVWQEQKELAFTIHADPDFIPKSAFDQHIIVGGRFYDVLDGKYTIEENHNHCVLHLESQHRLSSPFNKYAGFWSEWVMNQIQGSILTVIKNRCEKESSIPESNKQAF